jgi:anti-sigma B factor antagonist
MEGAMPELDELLWVERFVENHSVVVRASGELDIVTAPRLSSQLDLAEAIVVPPAPVVLDLARITFLASAGLSVLVNHHERCARLGSRLEIVVNGTAVTRPLEVTGLYEHLSITSVLVGGRA